MKLRITLKKYTMDPSSVESFLFEHSCFNFGDVEEGFGEIAKFDWDCLLPTMDANVYKVKHYIKNHKEDSSIKLLKPPNKNDVQVETIRVQNLVYFPFYLMKMVLNKDLSPRKVFLLFESTIDAGKLACEAILDF